jgi:phage protein U
MPLFAQLGDQQFEVLYFLAMDGTRQATFAEHARVNGKPRLQATGLGLEQRTVRLAFDRWMTGDPDKQVAAIDAMRIKQDPVVFVLGTGRVLGEYVITEIAETLTDADPVGATLRVELNVTLRENADPDAAAAAARAAKAKAEALARNAVQPGGAANAVMLGPFKLSDVLKVAKLAVKTFNQTRKVLTLIGKAAADPSRIGELASKAAGIDPHLAAVGTAIASGAAVYSGVHAAQAMITRIRELQAGIASAAAAHNLAYCQYASIELGQLQKKYERAMSPLTGLVASRGA